MCFSIELLRVIFKIGIDRYEPKSTSFLLPSIFKKGHYLILSLVVPFIKSSRAASLQETPGSDEVYY